MATQRRFLLIAACAVIFLSVYGCGGGGGETPTTDAGVVDVASVMTVQCPDGTIVGSDMTCPPTGSGIIALPSTYQFVGSSNFRLQPGETINRGILQFLCEGDQSCEVFLDAANDVASFTGGVVSATEIPAPLIGSNFTLAPGEHRLVRLPESNLLHMVICGHPDEACEIRDFQFDHTKANWVWLGTNDGHLLVSDDETGFYLVLARKQA